MEKKKKNVVTDVLVKLSRTGIKTVNDRSAAITAGWFTETALRLRIVEGYRCTEIIGGVVLILTIHNETKVTKLLGLHHCEFKLQSVR